jgi:hypothetical protein
MRIDIGVLFLTDKIHHQRRFPRPYDGLTSGFSQGKTLQSAPRSKAAAHRHRALCPTDNIGHHRRFPPTLHWAYQRIFAGKNSAISSS